MGTKNNPSEFWGGEIGNCELVKLVLESMLLERKKRTYGG